jgi:hypothetical protein
MRANRWKPEERSVCSKCPFSAQGGWGLVAPPCAETFRFLHRSGWVRVGLISLLLTSCYQEDSGSRRSPNISESRYSLSRKGNLPRHNRHLPQFEGR